jgi:site-specific DNA recombinase
MRAAIYIRVSTERQAEEDRVSLEAQEADCRAYCESRGYQVVEVYRDVGYSGASKNRPAFQRMLKDARAGKFDVIIAWKSDRLFRGVYPAAALMEAVEGTDITTEAVKDAIDLKTLPVLAAAGKWELENIKERCCMSARGRAAKGRITGTVRYGYRIGDDGRPEVIAAEAEIVRRIYEMYLKGEPPVWRPMSCERSTKALNDAGVPTRKGIWYSSLVKAILSDPCYTGQGRWGLRKHYRKDDGNGQDKHMTKWMPESEWLQIPYPPIIDDKTYHEATLRRHNQTRVKTGRLSSDDYPLKGILWCEQHGKLFSTHCSYRKNHVNRYYVCLSGSRYQDRCGACAHPRFNADDLEFRLTKWVYRYLLDPEQLQALKDGYIKRLKDGGGMEALHRAKENLKQLDEESKRVLIGYEKGYRSEAEMELRMKGINEQREYFQDELQRLEASYGDLEAQVEALEALGDKDQVSAAWEERQPAGP